MNLDFSSPKIYLNLERFFQSLCKLSGDKNYLYDKIFKSFSHETNVSGKHLQNTHVLNLNATENFFYDCITNSFDP